MNQTIYPKTRGIRVDKYEMQKSHFYDSMKGYTMISFCCIECGTVELTTGDSVFSLKAGDVFAVSPGCRYQSRWTGAPHISFYSIHLIPEPDAQYHIFPLQKIESLSVPETCTRAQALYALFQSEDYVDRMRAISLFFGFYAEALEGLAGTSLHHLSHPLVSAMQYIDRHYREECEIDILCEKAFVSSSHLYYLFRSELNTTPVHYRNRLRIDKCSELLRATALAEIDIAESQGFRSLPYFRECFQKQVGMTPFQYRSMINKKKKRTG